MLVHLPKDGLLKGQNFGPSFGISSGQEKKTVSIDTDSKYAFATVHIHKPIYK